MEFDTSDRIRQPLPKQSKAPFIVVALMVSSVAATAIYLVKDKKPDLMQPAKKEIALIEKAVKQPGNNNQVQGRPTTAQPVKRQALEKQTISRQRAQAQAAKSDLNDQGKQVVFNDQNYRPRQVANVIQSVEVRPRQVNRNSSRNQIIERSATWSWTAYTMKNRSRKTTQTGRFTYHVRNGMVLTNTVCQNEKAGTERYRNCRKGAKEYFKRNCGSSNQIACTGADLAP